MERRLRSVKQFHPVSIRSGASASASSATFSETATMRPRDLYQKCAFRAVGFVSLKNEKLKAEITLSFLIHLVSVKFLAVTALTLHLALDSTCLPKPLIYRKELQHQWLR